MTPFNLIVFLLTGCWHSLENAPKIQSDAQPFFHDALERDDIVVSEYKTSLICPDNQPASIFVVYPQNSEINDTAAISSEEVAIIFHSGALAYQTSYQIDLRIIPERLTSEWSKNKIWETLGMSLYPTDSNERNFGDLAVTLANQGWIQVYPANCWGDQWHNNTSDDSAWPQRANAESYISTEEDLEESDETSIYGNISRNGLRMVEEVMIQTYEPLEQVNSIIPEKLAERLQSAPKHWIGLGDGGRAIAELLLLDQYSDLGYTPSSIIFDSTPMNMSPYLENEDTFVNAYNAIVNIYNLSASEPELQRNPDEYAWDKIASDHWPENYGLFWSSGDTQFPIQTLQPFAQSLDSGNQVEENAPTFVYDTTQFGHIFINGNLKLAESSFLFMSTKTFISPENIPAEDDSSENASEDTESTSEEDANTEESSE